MDRIEKSQAFDLKEIIIYPVRHGRYYFAHNQYAIVFVNKYLVYENDAPLVFSSEEMAEEKRKQLVNNGLLGDKSTSVTLIDSMFIRES